MTQPTRAAIAGVHGYVPGYVLTNAELEQGIARIWQVMRDCMDRGLAQATTAI